MKIEIQAVTGSGLETYLLQSEGYRITGRIEMDYPADRECLADWLTDGQPHKIFLPNGRYLRVGHTYAANWRAVGGGGDGLRDGDARTIRGAYNTYVPALDVLDRLSSGESIWIYPDADKRSVGELMEIK